MVFFRIENLKLITVLLTLISISVANAESAFKNLSNLKVRSQSGNFDVELYSTPSLYGPVNDLIQKFSTQIVESYSMSRTIYLKSECSFEWIFSSSDKDSFSVVIEVTQWDESFAISRCDNFAFTLYSIKADQKQIPEAFSEALKIVADEKPGLGRPLIYFISDRSRKLQATPLICGSSTFYENGQCINCPDNCLECSSATLCDLCNTGSYDSNTQTLISAYYIDSNFQCNECLIVGCSICTSSTFCEACVQSYALTFDNQCIQDSSGCTQYSDSNVCLSCVEGMCLYSGSCFTCIIYCESYDQSGNCLSCVEGSLVYGGNCIGCPTPCSICAQDWSCTTCDSPYLYQDGGNCAFCNILGCEVCDSLTTCSSCSSGYLLTTSGSCSPCPGQCYKCISNVCITCGSGYYLDSITNNCLPCLDSCLECSEANSCTVCKQGVAVMGACSGCSENCVSCTPYGCTQCEDSYYYDKVVNSCIKCIAGCASCTGIYNCYIPIPSFVVFYNYDGFNYWFSVKNISPHCLYNGYDDVCDVPEGGYFTNNDFGIVQNCFSNCQICSDLTSSSCTICLPGYWFNADGYCVSCTYGCNDCSEGLCTGCIQGFYYESTTQNCLQCMANCDVCYDVISCQVCSEGFYYDTGVCVDCQKNCKICTNGQNCVQCFEKFYKNSNGGCSQCTNSCSLCQNSETCIKCIDGYFPDSSGTCFSCPVGCNHCIDSIACRECSTGYYLDTNYICQYNGDYCAITVISQWFSFYNYCGYCIDGASYDSSGTICILCPLNCALCYMNFYSASQICTKCIDGYFVTSSGDCGICGDNCINCVSSTYCLACEINTVMQESIADDGSTSLMCSPISDNCKAYAISNSDGTKVINCITCIAGFFLSNNNCVRCIQCCLKCSDLNSCSECAVGLDYNSATNTCSCGSGFYYSNNNCLSCIDNCLSCSNDNSCLECATNYFYDSVAKACASCAYECIQCGNANSCQICNLNFYLGTSNQCIPCPSYCDGGCQGLNSCNSCIQSYYYKGGACIPCMKYCLSCLGSSDCSQCASGTVFNGVRCLPCISGCATCSNLSSCNSCQNGYYYSSNLCLPCTDPNCNSCTMKSCNSCNDGTYLDPGTQTCKTCLQNCALCSSNTTCDTCQSTYFKNPVAGSVCISCGSSCLTCLGSNNCISCDYGTYLTSGICTSCPKNCILCDSKDICQVCSSGYSLNAAGICFNCGTNCNSCTPKGYCLSCAYGFYLDDTPFCRPCTSNCALCLDGVYCQACVFGYILQSNNICGKCGNGCAACDDNLLCSNCIDSYKLVNSSCLVCSNIGVVAIGISSDFTQLMITLESPIDNIGFKCSDVITTNGNFGKGWTCMPTGANITIVFGSSYSFDDSNLISINPITLYQSPCTNNSFINITASYSVLPPIPTGIVKGLPVQSVACSGGNLEYYIDGVSGSANFPVQATWNATVTPANQKVSDFVSGLNGTRIDIPMSLFQQINSLINVSAVIASPMKRCTQSFFVTQLVGIRQINVAIDLGSAVSVYSSQKLVLNTIIVDSCGTANTANYTWKVTSSSSSSLPINTIFNPTLPQRLILPSNTLPPNNVFTLTVTVSSSDIIGTSSITVISLSDPLVCILNKNDGNISPAIDLLIDGSQSYDPNKLGNSIMFSWSCNDLTNQGDCTDADNKPLVNQEKNAKLSISASRLVPGSKIQISLTVQTKDLRQSSCNVTFYLIKGLSTDVQINFHQSIVLPSNSLNLQGIISSKTQYVLKWTQSMGTGVNIENNSLPNLFLSPNTLGVGQTYMFTLMATELQSKLIASASVTFVTTQPPQCVGFLLTNPQTGMALTKSFTSSIDSCSDQDSTGMPLSYSFAVTPQNSQSIYITKPQSFNSANFVLFQGIFGVFVRVCDSLSACSYYQMSNSLTVTPFTGRQLSTLDPVALYNSLIQSNAYSTVLYGISVIATFSMTASQVDTIYNSAVSYIQTESVDADTIDMMMKLVLQIIISQNSTLTYERVNIYTQYILSLINNSTDEVNSNLVNLAITLTVQIIKVKLYDIQFISLTNVFLDQITNKYAVNMLPGTVITNSTLSSITFYRLRQISSNYTNRTINLSKDTSVTIQSLPFNNSNIVDLNLKIIPDPTGYSNILDITFTNTGSISNNSVNLTSGSDISLTTPTVLFKLPVLKNATGLWGCEYYSGSSWGTGGCTFESSKNNTVTMRISCSAMFRLYDSNFIPTSSGGKNYGPVILSGILGLILIIGYPISYFFGKKKITRNTMAVYNDVTFHLDSNFKLEQKDQKKPEIQVSRKKPTQKIEPLDEENKQNIEPEQNNEKIQQYIESEGLIEGNSQFIVPGNSLEENLPEIEPEYINQNNQYIEPDEKNLQGNISEKLHEEIPEDIMTGRVREDMKPKITDITANHFEITRDVQESKMKMLIRSHLLLGIFSKDPDFIEADRILAICLILATQITLQGVLIGYHSISLDEVISMVACAIISVVLTVPLHVAQLNLRKIMRRLCSCVTVLGFIAFGANFALTVAIAVKLTSNHTQWVITFFWGVLFELILESIFMEIKYMSIRSK